MSLIIISEKQVELRGERRACDDITGVCVCGVAWIVAQLLTMIHLCAGEMQPIGLVDISSGGVNK